MTDAGAVGDAVARTRLVGRTRELEVIAGEFDRARRGGFRTVLLVGEPGMGKTRLAHEAMAAAASQGAAGLSARGYSLGATATFGLWPEAWDRYLRGLPPEEVAELAAGSVADLAPALSSVAAVVSPLPPGGEDWGRMLGAWATLLRRVAGTAPTVCCLDDLHLADTSSVQLLDYLAHNCAESPALVVATARSAELAEAPELLGVVHGLEQNGLMRRVVVEPLEHDELAEVVEALVAAPPPRELLDWLTEWSAGNPLYVTELVRALLEQGADLSAPILPTVPTALAERVRLRLGRLAPAARDVIELLAVLGRRVELGSLAAVTDIGTEALTSALEELTQAGLVGESERGRRISVEITHPVLAEAVYAGIGATRRASLHRRAARALMRRGRPGEAAGAAGRCTWPERTTCWGSARRTTTEQSLPCAPPPTSSVRRRPWCVAGGCSTRWPGAAPRDAGRRPRPRGPAR